MLLKDCPVGSFVRLASFKSVDASSMTWWDGEFIVNEDILNERSFVIDRDGDIRDDVFDDEGYQFEIVNTPSCTPNTITLNGKTYKLKPHTEPRLTVIDGVTYEMEEI